MRVWWSTTDAEPVQETGQVVDDLNSWNVGTSVGNSVGGKVGTVGGDPGGGTVGPLVRERSWRTQENIAYPTALLSPYLY